jgi:hypothetical protein
LASVALSCAFQYSPGPGSGMMGLLGPITQPSLMEPASIARETPVTSGTFDVRPIRADQEPARGICSEVCRGTAR